MTCEPSPRELNPSDLTIMLRYDPGTGKLFWRHRPLSMFNVKDTSRLDGVASRWNKMFAGKEAFTCSKEGYKQGSIWQRLYGAHRVIWAMVYSEWPKGEIDHINGDRADNRLENLRCVDHQTNTQNRKNRSDNKYGAPGIYRIRSGRFQAYAMRGGKWRSLGVFDDAYQAKLARKKAMSELGYHENHGRL